MRGNIPYGCGQCLPCRVNLRRQWMWRQFLEGLTHEENAFVTLTYNEEHVPANGALEPRELQLFIKKLRFAIYPLRVRYFAVGEYGEKNLRPHYHLSLFGMSGFTVVPCGDKFSTGAQIINRCWERDGRSLGFTRTDEFNHLTAQYVAGYTVKKLKDRKDGRKWIVPEFSRMSRRPGIGAAAMETIGRQLSSNYQTWDSGDVPRQLRVGKKLIPIGRYLLGKLRDEVGFSAEYQQEVRNRQTYERSVEQAVSLQSLLTSEEGLKTFKGAFLHDIEAKIIQVEARAKLYAKKDTI